MKVLFIARRLRQDDSDLKSHSLALLAGALSDQDVQVRIVRPHIAAAASGGVVPEQPADVPDDIDSLEARRMALAGSPQASRAAVMNYLGDEFGAAVRIRREFEPALVHAHWWFPDGLVGSWLSAFASLPLVTSIHAEEHAHAQAGRPTRSLLRHVLSRSAAVTASTRALVPQLSELAGVPEPVLAPLPLPTSLLAPSGANGRKDIVIAASARYRDGLLRAVARGLRSTDWSVTLIHARSAAGDPEPDAADASVSDAPTAPGREVHPTRWADVAAALAGARALVVAGGDEHSRLLAAAGMLCGVPPIIMGAGPLSDLAHESNGTGFWMSDESAGGLADVLSDDRRLADAGDSARLFGLATYAPESCAARMVAVYLRAVGDHA